MESTFVDFLEFGDAEASKMQIGYGNYGCSHYRRRCRIRAPCCNEIFDCRHCHNDVKNGLETNPLDRHDIPRHEVAKVICSLCETEQDVQQNCINCGVCMGKYYCSKCKFFDDDVIFRTSHWFQKINTIVRNVEYAELEERKISSIATNAFLFDTMRDITVLPCGHTIHLECLKEMEQHGRYSCPVCSKSICDMTGLWKKLDEEISETPMPETYQNKMAWILCNDCGANSRVQFHIVANKCLSCNSYNTRQTRGGPAASCPSRMTEIIS
ncbi:hypothetical protein SADUNF_Sadunf09G0003000 [Salix dunnii]|uniref:Uncharacterized protein n=1 Tax=Salix dunnii TaxID=1413687 RepID=A0A835MZD0_9ROSI|nr:hypothetical protein SADUNF_Sadunf09G0003000 [Salix dunnii]